MVQLTVVNDDITERPCDLLLLKHADGFYGVDEVVSERLRFSSSVLVGEGVFFVGQNIEASKVLYIGVGPIGQFRYPQIRAFGRRALEVARGSGRIEVLCTPIHGPGYGLDEREAFLSLVGGFLDGIESGAFPESLKHIEIVELNSSRAKRLEKILSEVIGPSSALKSKPAHLQGTQTSLGLGVTAHESLSSYGEQSERKSTLFVAMPFAEEHSDVWEIAIQESCQAAGLVCERVDELAYTGDVLKQITSRLQKASGVLALLNDANPNVFLEIGFAWGMDRTTV